MPCRDPPASPIPPTLPTSPTLLGSQRHKPVTGHAGVPRLSCATNTNTCHEKKPRGDAIQTSICSLTHPFFPFLPPFSLTGLLRDVIASVQPPSGWKVLIVDQVTLRIISSCARNYDIMEDGVTCKIFCSLFRCFRSNKVEHVRCCSPLSKFRLNPALVTYHMV